MRNSALRQVYVAMNRRLQSLRFRSNLEAAKWDRAIREHGEMIEALDGFDRIVFPYENETGRTIKDCLRGFETKPQRVALIIGPEGGFSDEEARQLKDSGADCVSLGKTILRTDTAESHSGAR